MASSSSQSSTSLSSSSSLSDDDNDRNQCRHDERKHRRRQHHHHHHHHYRHHRHNDHKQPRHQHSLVSLQTNGAAPVAGTTSAEFAALANTFLVQACLATGKVPTSSIAPWGLRLSCHDDNHNDVEASKDEAITCSVPDNETGPYTALSVDKPGVVRVSATLLVASNCQGPTNSPSLQALLVFVPRRGSAQLVAIAPATSFTAIDSVFYTARIQLGPFPYHVTCPGQFEVHFCTPSPSTAEPCMALLLAGSCLNVAGQHQVASRKRHCQRHHSSLECELQPKPQPPSGCQSCTLASGCQVERA